MSPRDLPGLGVTELHHQGSELFDDWSETLLDELLDYCANAGVEVAAFGNSTGIDLMWIRSDQKFLNTETLWLRNDLLPHSASTVLQCMLCPSCMASFDPNWAFLSY